MFWFGGSQATLRRQPVFPTIRSVAPAISVEGHPGKHALDARPAAVSPKKPGKAQIPMVRRYLNQRKSQKTSGTSVPKPLKNENLYPLWPDFGELMVWYLVHQGKPRQNPSPVWRRLGEPIERGALCLEKIKPPGLDNASLAPFDHLQSRDWQKSSQGNAAFAIEVMLFRS